MHGVTRGEKEAKHRLGSIGHPSWGWLVIPTLMSWPKIWSTLGVTPYRVELYGKAPLLIGRSLPVIVRAPASAEYKFKALSPTAYVSHPSSVSCNWRAALFIIYTF